jgi:hypothetical protein
MGNATGNTMQALATAREKVWRQEQWRTGEKNRRRTMEKTGEEKWKQGTRSPAADRSAPK